MNLAKLLPRMGAALIAAAMLAATGSVAGEPLKIGFEFEGNAQLTNSVSAYYGIGYVDSEIDKAADPADVGNLVRFLCSAQAAYVTGTVLSVNGGLLIF